MELKPNANVTMVNEIITEDHQWDTQKLRENFSTRSAIEVIHTPISWTLREDNLFCPLSSDERYTVKSGYRSLVELPLPCILMCLAQLVSLRSRGRLFGRLQCMRKSNILCGVYATVPSQLCTEGEWLLILYALSVKVVMIPLSIFSLFVHGLSHAGLLSN